MQINIKELIRTKKIIIFLIIFILIASLAIIYKFNIFNWFDSASKKISQVRDWRYELSDLAPKYTEAALLVPPSVSKNSNIVLNLPEDLSKTEVIRTIKFTPKVAGDWIEQEAEKVMVYKPKEELKVGSYYTVTIDYNKGTIGGDFVVEENPEVVNVFPASGSETFEDTDITILFNRPMAPLSSLDIMAPETVPVEISPETPGRFKWIGTRSLQFIPEDDLARSSNYTVKIKPEFTSMDGLSIDGFEHKFITRKLRYESETYSGVNELVYNQPMKIYFNQEVDLNRTKDKISVKKTENNRNIEIIIEYGERKVYDYESDGFKDVEDKSILFIYNKQDKHGRTRLWNFEAKYDLMISGAAPLEGNIELLERRQHNYQVTGIIKEISAESENSTWVEKDLFDAYGKLIVEFYEEIDLERSVINGDKLAEKNYGEKCQEDESGVVVRTNSECEKETDHAKLVFDFDES